MAAMKAQCDSIQNAIHGSGGLVEQAKAAQANGTFAQFLAQLAQQFEPVLAALLQGFLSGLIKPPAPNPTPAQTK